MMTSFSRRLLICFLLAMVNTAFADESVRLASGEWKPYQSKDLEYAGVVSRIVTEAFALEGVRVEFGYFPWKRAYHYAETGQWDGTFVWFDTPERRKLFYISDPVIDISYVFFHKKNYAFNWQSIHDLKSIRVGGSLGYDYGPAFQTAEQDGLINVIRKPTDAENFLRLFNGQIHIFPCDIEVGYGLIRKHFESDKVQQFTHHPLPVRADPHHLLLSKKNKRNKRLIRLFNSGLQRLKASGKFDQYLAESRRGDYHR